MCKGSLIKASLVCSQIDSKTPNPCSQSNNLILIIGLGLKYSGKEDRTKNYINIGLM
jgi:hypothetical protein